MKYKECNHVELKQIIPKDFSFEEEVVSFLNSEEGGVIYVGVDDDGSAAGLDNLDKTQLTIKDRIKKQYCSIYIGVV